jgi:hypothetical protein
MFVLAVIIVLSGHFVYNRFTTYVAREKAQKFAKITAQAWVAAAKFNQNPDKYRQYRDSMLAAENSSIEEINEYLKSQNKKSEKYIHYATLVSVYVDSLVQYEDSLLKITTPAMIDTAIRIR